MKNHALNAVLSGEEEALISTSVAVSAKVGNARQADMFDLGPLPETSRTR